MIEQFKNLFVCKAFEIEKFLIDEINKIVEDKNLKLVVEQNCNDFKLSIQNLNSSEVDFQMVVDKAVTMLDGYIYAENDKALEDALVEVAIKKNIKIGCAESITGGLVSASIVNVAGSSAVMSEGYVVYSNESKVRLLHVKLSTIENFGAVSQEVAYQMADKVVSNKSIDFAISTTGCAGPSSDENHTPIGLAYIGYGSKNNIKVEECFYEGSRNKIRCYVKNKALYLALQYINKI